jgi:nuclease S1
MALRYAERQDSLTKIFSKCGGVEVLSSGTAIVMDETPGLRIGRSVPHSRAPGSFCRSPQFENHTHRRTRFRYTPSMRVRVGWVLTLVLVVGCRDAAAWGCEGHRAIVFVAERLLSPAILARAKATLAAAPIDPTLRRFCDSVADDPIADSATWADDYRDIEATTFGWHFINVPRDAALTTSNERQYCPRGNCVVDAIAAQFRMLTASSDPISKGNALRFLLHFIGDMHQPLHATTNGDRGGNCVPVTYHDRVPEQNDRGDWSPNLHGVWDSNMIRTFMSARRLGDARALASYIAATLPLPISVAKVTPTRDTVVGWAQQAHAIGQTVVYARLPIAVPAEPASAAILASCADNHGIARRMLAKREVIDSRYEGASIPVILRQLRAAGLRLAAVLKAAYP